jgi:hypothetical protein
MSFLWPSSRNDHSLHLMPAGRHQRGDYWKALTSLLRTISLPTRMEA